MSTTHYFDVGFDLNLPCGPNCLKQTKLSSAAKGLCGEGNPSHEHRTEYNVDVLVKCDFWTENYGADADGNRGVMTDMRETDGWEIKKIQRYGHDICGDPMVTLTFADLPAEERALIEHLIEHEVENWEPDETDFGPDVPDYEED